MQDYLTYRQAADLLNTSVDNIRHKVQRGQLSAFTHPAKPALKVIPRQEVEALRYGPILEPMADLPEPPPPYPMPTTSQPAATPATRAPATPSPMAPALVGGISPEQEAAEFNMLYQLHRQNELLKLADHLTAEMAARRDRINKREMGGYAAQWLQGQVVVEADPYPALPPPRKRQP